MAMTPKPRNAPTPIAAGRFRPALPCFLVGSDGSAPSEAVSVSATVLLLKVWSPVDLDLQQLAFFVFHQVVDLGGVGLGALVEILLGASDLVLACLAVLLDAGELLH